MVDDPYQRAHDTATAIAARFGIGGLDVALVLGSGWSAAAGALGRAGRTVGECQLAELPHCVPPTVVGHGASLRVVETAAGRLAGVFTGRTHFYERRDAIEAVHPVRAATAAGARIVVLTNGCGGLRPEWPAGTPVLISDHLNLTAASPLRGGTFVDLTDAYAPRLRALAREVDPTLDEGVYVQFAGPQFETPAEVRMAARLGGDLVGMSTTLETIAAREAGAEVLGISLVTNLAAGISPTPLHHAEVLEAGRAAGPRLTALLAGIVARL